MRIALLIDSWFPEWGGGQVNAEEISRRLCAGDLAWIGRGCCLEEEGEHYNDTYHYSSRVEIDVFTRKLRVKRRAEFLSKKVGRVGGLRVFRLGPAAPVFFWPARIWWLLWVVARVWWEHRRRSYDLIHAHANAAILPGKVLAMILGKPLVLTIHGVNVLETAPGSVLARVERWLLAGIEADEVISVQEHFGDFVSVHRKITVIPNGVDIEEYDRVKARKARFFKMVWVGRFDEVKGLEILLRAVERLVSVAGSAVGDGVRSGGFEVHLIGGGGSPGYERKIKDMVEELGLSGVVEFRGVITGKEKIKELKSAHLLVLPSLSEGQPVTLLEAWAAKLPVVVTEVGDNSRYVEEGVNGWLVPPGEVGVLAEVLGKVKRMSGKDLARMGRAGYGLVKERFGWERAAEETLRVYRRVVGEV